MESNSWSRAVCSFQLKNYAGLKVLLQAGREHVHAPPRRCPIRLLATGGGKGLRDRLFYCFTDFAGMFLNPAKQFLGLAFDVSEIVVHEPGPFLFHLAFGDFPVAFDFKFDHKIS
jgi:hypothetical protein